MVNLSSIEVLDLSAAHGDSHELSSVMVLAFAVFWVFLSGLGELVHLVLALLSDDVVGTDLVLNLAELDVSVHGALSDWDNLLDDVPEDALSAWSSGQGALIGEPSVVVDQGDESSQVQWAHDIGLLEDLTTILVEQDLLLGLLGLLELLLIDEVLQELVVEEDVGVLTNSVVEVRIWHDLEEEAEDTSEELRSLWILGIDLHWIVLLGDEMNDMHLKVHKLAVNGVLRW